MKPTILSKTHLINLITVFCVLTVLTYNQCIHDSLAKDHKKYFYNDLEEHQERILQEQAPEIDRLRIFVDYSQVSVGNLTAINYVKRVTNISATYFYNVLKVNRVKKVFYPPDVSRQCNSLMIPEHYVSEGAIGDVAVVCGNQENRRVRYVAKSLPCAFLESNKRPIWGMMQWNNAFLKFDQQGFQEILYVGIHEFTHILGFSALMYEIYPGGNPLIEEPETGDKYLTTKRINEEVEAHYNCTNGKGMLLEDQDGTLIASHWERKVAGNQYMISSNKKGSFVSRVTLALFQSTGWYPEVNYTYAQKSTWGKNKGCDFLNIDNCDSEEFCGDSSFSCDWEGTAIGRCGNDIFAGGCRLYRYFVNTICIDETFELKNLNSRLNTLQRGGHYSKCFNSDYREKGISPTRLNNRCYISICSFSRNFIYILVGRNIIICRSPGFNVSAPIGLEGNLFCPDNFENYCENKPTCAFHCNNNGACINGLCLCTGSTTLTPTCLDVSDLLAPIGTTGGLLKSTNRLGRGLSKRYRFNSKCYNGFIFDSKWGECLRCSDVFNCQNCDQEGCTACDNGAAPRSGRC